jgi:hypothetical protein
LTVNKVNWAKVGRVAEPGRYMFKFGWVTLYRPPAAETEDDFRLGVFELPDDSSQDQK